MYLQNFLQKRMLQFVSASNSKDSPHPNHVFTIPNSYPHPLPTPHLTPTIHTNILPPLIPHVRLTKTTSPNLTPNTLGKHKLPTSRTEVLPTLRTRTTVSYFGTIRDATPAVVGVTGTAGVEFGSVGGCWVAAWTW